MPEKRVLYFDIAVSSLSESRECIAMSTQLTSQLQALAASAGLDKTKRPKGQPSLLYEPHIAADIGTEDVYDRALKGASCHHTASLLQHCCLQTCHCLGGPSTNCTAIIAPARVQRFVQSGTCC